MCAAVIRSDLQPGLHMDRDARHCHFLVYSASNHMAPPSPASQRRPKRQRYVSATGWPLEGPAYRRISADSGLRPQRLVAACLDFRQGSLPLTHSHSLPPRMFNHCTFLIALQAFLGCGALRALETQWCMHMWVEPRSIAVIDQRQTPAGAGPQVCDWRGSSVSGRSAASCPTYKRIRSRIPRHRPRPSCHVSVSSLTL